MTELAEGPHSAPDDRSEQRSRSKPGHRLHFKPRLWGLSYDSDRSYPSYCIKFDARWSRRDYKIFVIHHSLYILSTRRRRKIHSRGSGPLTQDLQLQNTYKSQLNHRRLFSNILSKIKYQLVENMAQVILYDNPSRFGTGTCWSPNVWKSEYRLPPSDSRSITTNYQP